jgi:hypothetical protein
VKTPTNDNVCSDDFKARAFMTDVSPGKPSAGAPIFHPVAPWGANPIQQPK